MLTATIKSEADAEAFAADVCNMMNDFRRLYNFGFDKRKLQRRLERYIAAKRTELKKLALKELAVVKQISGEASDWASASSTYFAKDFNPAHDSKDESQKRELFMEEFQGSDVRNTLDTAIERIELYRVISKLGMAMERVIKDAMEAMVFPKPFVPSRPLPSSRSKRVVA